jgi:hypothetical protein
MARRWRLLRSHCGNKPVVVSREEARERLGGYYNLAEAFVRLSNGERLETVGHTYWMEFENQGEQNGGEEEKVKTGINDDDQAGRDSHGGQTRLFGNGRVDPF